MSQVAERKRPDPYADESTMVRRKRGVTIGAYQGLTIASLTCLVGALFFIAVGSMAQRVVAVAALIIAAAFLVSMARRKSRSVESPRTQMLVAVWLAAASFLATREPVAAVLDRWGHRIVPLVFIAIGLVLLAGGISS